MKTHLQKPHVEAFQHGNRTGRRNWLGLSHWSLCLSIALLCVVPLWCALVQITPLLAQDATPSTDQNSRKFITQEIRYRAAGAGEVFLVWGVNGWKSLPATQRPVGTLVKGSIMHTPMQRLNDAFAARVRVPPGATIDYVFHITKMNSGAVEVWDTNGQAGKGYHTVAGKAGMVKVSAGLARPHAAQIPDAPVSWMSRFITICTLVVIGIALLLGVRRYHAASQSLELAAFRLLNNIPVLRGYSARLPIRRIIYLRDLLKELIGRDLKATYKNSVLGMAWSVLNPLLYLLVFSYIFRSVLKVGTHPNYAAFTFTGIVVWTWFQTSLNLAVNGIRNNRDLVLQPGFAVATLPIIAVTTNLVNFLISMPLLLVMLVGSGVHPHAVILLLPVVMVIQFILTLSLAYLVAAINVTFRDMQHMLIVFLHLFFYLTPIFYDVNKIPQQYKSFLLLNPMTHLVGAYRDILIEGVAPHWMALAVIAVIAVSLLSLSYRIFIRASHRFVEEL